MIEIIRNTSAETWECWIGGRIWEWNDDLQLLLKKMASQAEQIEEDIID